LRASEVLIVVEIVSRVVRMDNKTKRQ